MTLAEWQRFPKRRDQLLYNCSEFEHCNDEWLPFPIGMSWEIIKYGGAVDDCFKGSHNHPLMCAIRDGTDQQRRSKGFNRRFILDILRGNGIQNVEMTSAEYLRMLPEYQFVISPEGNGIDCHRHYEALMAGVIPIVERNERLYEKYGNCPFVMTDDYSEITPEYLASLYPTLLHKTWDFSRLCMDTFDADTQAVIRRNGNYWGLRTAGRTWY